MCFSYRHKRNYIYASTVKPYYILTVKKAFVKFMLYITEYAICSRRILWGKRGKGATVAGV